MKNRITTIIFDFGGVLGLPQDPERRKAMAELCRLPLERFICLYTRNRLELDRGALSAEAYWGEILADAGVQPVPELVARIEREDCQGWTRINERVISWVKELRGAGYRTAILSNMPIAKLAFMRESDAFRWLDDFDALVWSCDHLLVKPEAPLYRICLERLGADPRDCLFLDDTPLNVEGARAVGINAEVFTSAAEIAPLLAGTWGLPVRSLTGAGTR